MYAKLIGEVGTEIDVLYRLPLDEIAAKVGSVIADQIAAVRAGSLSFLPGRRKIWQGNERIEEVRQ